MGFLTSCYARAIEVADELGSRPAWPSRWSAPGIYGWPKHDAIRAAVDTLRSTPTQVEQARIVAFGRASYEEISGALGR